MYEQVVRNPDLAEAGAAPRWPPRSLPRSRWKSMSSPASTGPAALDGKVGAHYLLSVLVGAQPRGLPGMAIVRIELQRASQGMNLDNVIVRGLTAPVTPPCSKSR